EVYKNQDQAAAAMEKQDMEAFNQQPGLAVQRKKDEAAIEEYLKANNIQAQKTPWGSYVQVVQPGTGQKPKYGQFMMLRYTGKDLQGNVFDSNNKPGAPLMPFQVGAGGTIPGFADGVKQLSKGEKANIYVPSVLGYGERGTQVNPQTKEQAIKPNQNLVFEVEVVDVTDQRPGQPTVEKTDSTSK
ncbi:MAG TPA: FKBP-type peptidyl-prolyl cis-trans isomerase, partial [Flavisolibacter sp.]|nr:FKBP-type peptidyl-prolyl cis-trans isomerase [Flavisolibacter sp.]